MSKLRPVHRNFRKFSHFEWTEALCITIALPLLFSDTGPQIDR
jgi:hypothetical protein